MADEALRAVMARILALDAVIFTMLTLEFARLGPEYANAFADLMGDPPFSARSGILSDHHAEWFADVAVRAKVLHDELLQRAARAAQDVARKGQQPPR